MDSSCFFLSFIHDKIRNSVCGSFLPNLCCTSVFFWKCLKLTALTSCYMLVNDGAGKRNKNLSVYFCWNLLFCEGGGGGGGGLICRSKFQAAPEAKPHINYKMYLGTCFSM